MYEAKNLLAGQRLNYTDSLSILRKMEVEGFGYKPDGRALAHLGLHNPFPAVEFLSGSDKSTVRPTRTLWVASKLYFELEEWEKVDRYLSILRKEYEEWGSYTEKQAITQNEPLRAIALARAGKMEEALNLSAKLPSGCYFCARARAIVHEAARQPEQADAWFDTAIRLAPDLPAAYRERGEVELARHNPAEALANAEEALLRGPRSADAIKLRADAKAALGRLGPALVEYRKASLLAPNWAALRIAWGETLLRAGLPAEALPHLRAARRLPRSASADQRLERAMRYLRARPS